MLSIFPYLRSGDYLEAIIVILSRCFVVFCCTPIHEFAHAYVSYKLGDETARLKGRLTINPIAHLDPLGALMIFLVGFGYAKPVPVNPRNFKDSKKGMVLTSLAGPFSNLIMAFISVFLYYGIFSIDSGESTVIYAISYFFYYAAWVNVMLAVFNFIPIPPLDGSKILLAVLPSKAYFKVMQYERYIMIALMIMLFVGVLDIPILWLSRLVMNILSFIPSLIF